MAKKVCLDTDICIALLKGESRAEKIADKIADNKVFVTSVTIFELRLRKENLDKVEDFLKDTYSLDFDNESAVIASDIYKKLKAKGKVTDFRDIFIASIASVNNCILATFNRKHFSNIEGLEILEF